MKRYRYRTPVFYGSWCGSRHDAVQDAIRTAQAVRARSEPDHIRWRFAGCAIEDSDNQAA
jgi:hypothetical protein